MKNYEIRFQQGSYLAFDGAVARFLPPVLEFLEFLGHLVDMVRLSAVHHFLTSRQQALDTLLPPVQVLAPLLFITKNTAKKYFPQEKIFAQHNT